MSRVHPTLADALIQWRKRRAYIKPEDWVFASKCYWGRRPYWGQAILRKYIRPAAQRAGIQKRFGWHTLRHTYSTLLRSVGTEFHNIDHAIRGTHEPDRRQYTQIGDGTSKTDGPIYDPKLGPNQVKGDYSGRPDDRWIFTSTNPFFQWNGIAALAAAADVLKRWDDALAKDCLDAAIKAWNDEKAHPTPAGGSHGGAPAGASGVLAASQGMLAGGRTGHNATGIAGAPATSSSTNAPTAPQPGSDRNGFSAGLEWTAALELTIAAHGAEPYKSRLRELFSQMIMQQQIGSRGWTAVRALPYLDPSAKDQMHEAVKMCLRQNPSAA